MGLPRENKGKRGVSRLWHENTTNKRGHKNVKHRMARSLKRSIRREAEKDA